jgi:hypothetical protein
MKRNKKLILTSDFGATFLTGTKRSFEEHKKTSEPTVKARYLGFSGASSAFAKEADPNATEQTKQKKRIGGKEPPSDSLLSNGICITPTIARCCFSLNKVNGEVNRSMGNK